MNEDIWEAIGPSLDPMPTMPPAFPRFLCPRCQMGFSTRSALTEHIADRHQHRRPMLLIEGREPPITHTIRRVLNASDFQMLFCTDIVMEIDGQRLPAAGLAAMGHQISAQREARVLLTLKNVPEAGISPEVSYYDISIHIPDPATLKNVEKAFLHHLVDDEATISTSRVTEFLRDAQKPGGANEYARALASFVLGVLAKDQVPGTIVALGWADHESKFKEAHAVLSTLDRPLARLVTGLIRFALNDFPREPTRSGYLRLDEVAAHLARLAGQNWPTPTVVATARQRRICPTDTGTDAVVATAEHLYHLPRWGAAAAEMLYGSLRALSRFPLDRAKLAAIGAEAALRLGASSDAESLLRSLLGNDVFGTWAEAQMTQLEAP